MSTIGVFQLVTNDGRQDALLTATAALNDRLYAIREAKNALLPPDQVNGPKSFPTLSEIDQTHLLFIFSQYKPYVAIVSEYTKVRAQGGIPSLGGTVLFDIPKFGDFLSDMVVHITLKGFSANLSTDKVKYCDYPGARLAKECTFAVNGNPIDIYTSHVYNVHRQCILPVGKRTAWDRMMGQEEVFDAFLTPDPTVNEYREYHRLSTGAQTLKHTQEDLDLWIPLLFWFNTDFQLALPAVSLTQGQTHVTVKLASVAEMCGGVPYLGGTGAFSAPVVSVCELYVNNLFVNPEIHDIFISRIGFQLIRIHRLESRLVDLANDNLCLNNIKYPIESLYFSFQPTVNIEGPDRLNSWDNYTQLTQQTVKMPVVTGVSTLAVQQMLYNKSTEIVDNISLSVQGVPIFEEAPGRLFNSYMQYNYGDALPTSSDSGIYTVHFALYPGKYQPSGSINISRAREFYLKYYSSYINSSAKAQFQMMATAINFLIISDGSCTLRYST